MGGNEGIRYVVKKITFDLNAVNFHPVQLGVYHLTMVSDIQLKQIIYHINNAFMDMYYTHDDAMILICKFRFITVYELLVFISSYNFCVHISF